MSPQSETPAFAIDGIDGVEIKITVRDDQEQRALVELGKADVEPQRRTVYFFDTRALALFDAGVILRARITRDAPDDSTVKVRPVVPAEIDARWKETEGFEVELDIVGDDPIFSAKLEARQRRDEIDEVAAGRRALHTLFSEDQEDLVRDYAPIGIAWERLSVLGPVEVHKWKLEPAGFPHEVTVEEWVLPDGSDLVEVSIKVPPREAVDAGSAFRALLTGHGLDPDGDQRAKARTVLEFFTTSH